MRSHYPGQKRETEGYLDVAGPEVSSNIVHCHFLCLQLSREPQMPSECPICQQHRKCCSSIPPTFISRLMSNITCDASADG